MSAAPALAAVMTASAKRGSADAPELDFYTLERAVEDGDPEAMYRLSMILKKGDLVERDIQSSTSLLLLAASHKHPAAMLELFRRYRDGRQGVPRDPVLAARWLVLALVEAEDGFRPPSSGHPGLSRWELKDLMVSAGVDLEELERRHVDASETGRPVDVDDLLTPEILDAMRERYLETKGPGDGPLGDYLSRSLKPDPESPPALQSPGGLDLARKLWREGYGVIPTRLDLADAIMSGEGVEGDLDEIFKRNRLAAELGDVTASLNVGLMLLNGIGTLSDDGEAAPHLKRALALSRPQAPFALWQISRRRPDLVSPDEGEDLLRLSAGMGHPMAMVAQALEQEMIDYEVIASEAAEGEPPAMFMMADRYRQGPPEVRDPEKSLSLYRRAAEKGHGKAAKTLERIYRFGHGVPADESEADKWRVLYECAKARKARRAEAVKGAAGEPPKKPAKKSAKKPLRKPKKTSGKKPRGK